MTSKKMVPEFGFQKVAVYKIVVQAELDESWSERLGGFEIKIERLKGKKPVSVLVGQINDQSALSGIMNMLYEFHIPIISVNMLSEKK
jgi:hypothetical protein